MLEAHFAVPLAGGVLDDDGHHQRRHHHADGVVEQQGGEAAGHEGQRPEQGAGGAGAGEDQVGGEAEELRLVQVGGDEQDAEQEDDDVQIDGAQRVFERERADQHHGDGAHHGAGRAIELHPAQLAAGDDQVGEGEDEEGRDHERGGTIRGALAMRH